MCATQRILAFPHAPLDLVRSSFPLKYRRQQVDLAKKNLKSIYISIIVRYFWLRPDRMKESQTRWFVMDDALSYSLSIFNFEMAANFYIVRDVTILNQRWNLTPYGSGTETRREVEVFFQGNLGNTRLTHSKYVAQPSDSSTGWMSMTTLRQPVFL